MFGFADTHLHITANLRAGGRVIHGEPFDRFGITEALGHDADDHGADGSQDVTGNLLRDGTAVRHPRHPRLADASPAGRPTTPTPTSRSTTVAPAGLDVGPAAGRRPDGRGPADLPDRADALALVQRDAHDQARGRTSSTACRTTSTPRAAGPAAAGSASSTTPRQARRVIEQGKLAVVIGVESSDPFDCSEPAGCRRARRRPRASRSSGGSASAAVHRPLGRQRVRRRGARGRHQGRLHQHLQPGRDRPLLQHRPLPRPEPGRGGGHDRPGRDADPRPVLPGRRRDPADAGLPRGQAVQLQGPDEARRLSGQADDDDRDADRDRPHERAGARPGPARSPPATRYPVISGHTGTGGALDADGAPHALPQRRPRDSATPDQAPSSPRGSSPSARTAIRATTSASAWAPTRAASLAPGPRRRRGRAARLPVQVLRRRGRPSPASTPASASSTSTPMASPTTACSPTCIAQMQRGPDGPAAMRTLFRSAESYLQMWELAERR